MGADIVFNHADYRLISNKVLKEFAKFGEVNLFLRGLVPLVGFKSSQVFYKRNERIAGESHYPLKKMLALACEGITSLSVKPLRLISSVGIMSTTVTLIVAIILLITKNFCQYSTVCVLFFIGGIQLVSVGIIGEYVGKIYMEVKHRPRYIISERTNNYESK